MNVRPAEWQKVHHLTCELQVKNDSVDFMQKNGAKTPRRSLCPLNASVEMLGDRWSLLILRDMMLRGARTYKEFFEASLEGIATNILADRLQRLERNGIIRAKPDTRDGRKMIYTLTQKGVDLAPVLTEMVLWAAKHEHTGNQPLIRQMRNNKEEFIAAVVQRLRATKN